MKLSSVLLQYLLFMDPSIGLEYSLVTQHCNVFDSTSMIRPCNRVMHTDMPTADEIEQIKSFFDNRPFSWAVEEHDTQTMRFLEEHQLSTRFSFPAMGMSLDVLQDKPCAVDCTVRKVDLKNKQELATFANIMAMSFTAHASQTEIVIHTLIRQTVPDALTLYLGYYQEQAAAVGMSLRHGSIVTLHWIGTLPEYRRKGLASAINYTALIDARNAGCNHAYLLASEIGKSLAARIGFEECARHAMYCNY